MKLRPNDTGDPATAQELENWRNLLSQWLRDPDFSADQGKPREWYRQSSQDWLTAVDNMLQPSLVRKKKRAARTKNSNETWEQRVEQLKNIKQKWNKN